MRLKILKARTCFLAGEENKELSKTELKIIKEIEENKYFHRTNIKGTDFSVLLAWDIPKLNDLASTASQFFDNAKFIAKENKVIKFPTVFLQMLYLSLELIMKSNIINMNNFLFKYKLSPEKMEIGCDFFIKNKYGHDLTKLFKWLDNNYRFLKDTNSEYGTEIKELPSPFTEARNSLEYICKKFKEDFDYVNTRYSQQKDLNNTEQTLNEKSKNRKNCDRIGQPNLDLETIFIITEYAFTKLDENNSYLAKQIN